MKTVYRQTKAGWVKVRKCPSFEYACRVAKELEEKTGIPHCVNQ